MAPLPRLLATAVGPGRQRDNRPVPVHQCPSCGARFCPACDALVPAHGGRGRPRIYCTKQCKWRAARQRRARMPELTEQQLLDYLASLPGPVLTSEYGAAPEME
jgi:hypothetical protein